MKKTIAILLILVIGMVGVFAGDDPDPVSSSEKTVYLETEVLAINQMIVTATSAIPTWATAFDEDSAFSDNALPYKGLTDSDNYGKDGTIAYLHARSNDRAGFSVSMDVTPLVSVTDEGTEYINFLAKCGTAVIWTSNATVNTEFATVGSKLYEGSVMPVISEAITINLSEELAEAAAGTYTGSIIFTYKAI